ncbi:MAG: PAS domain-containing protein [Rhodospirillales bacterium]|nr:PAS domain-containing protein [Rhodospirillales bacterium]
MALSLRRKKKDGDSEKPKAAEKPAAGKSAPAKDAPVKDDLPPRKMNKFVLGGAILIGAMIVGAIILAKLYVDEELKRETQAWQVRLGIVADSRVSAVNDWIDSNFKVLRELSQNASLQLYMSELAAVPPAGAAQPQAAESQSAADSLLQGLDGSGGGAGIGTSASQGFLRNLLIATAERSPFKAPPPVGEIAANVERVGVAGLGLVDKNAEPVISTPDMPPITGRIKEAVRKALDGEPAIVDMYLGASGEPTIGFALPVYAVQEGGAGARGIGAVVGIRLVNDTLWEKLIQPGTLTKTAETIIVRKNGGKVEYLSPLRDGTAALKRTMALASPNLAVSDAINIPGSFINNLDYAGDRVLMVSREVAQVPWILVRKVSREEALGPIETRLNFILGVFIAIIVIVTLTILFVWKNAASARASEALHRAQVMVERFENLTKFMRMVTDNQPTQIVAVDRNTVYTFANMPVAEKNGIPITDIKGKTMAAVVGPVKAQEYSSLIKRVIDDFEREQKIFTFGNPDILDPEDENAFQVVKVDGLPLRGDRDYPPGCLLVIDDITELQLARLRSEKMMKELIDTLVSVVDRRDPFSANHSSRVSEVSRAIAQEMGLDEIEVKTVDIAGSLMNLGKIFVPEELLMKTEDLTEEERMLVSNAYLTTVDLIEHVTFEGPVIETIRQFGETWDGKGPLGLKEEEIIITARTLAVANAFVGMVSPRAYRGAMPFRKVSDILMEQSENKFDRKPVTALVNYLENRGGMRRWAHFRVDPTVEDAAE